VSTARRTHGFRESVIRGMTRLAREYDSLNLAQGFPNFPAPELIKTAAARAIQDDINQYAITWGATRLRRALAATYAQRYGLDADPEREITVTCGATEAMIATLLALVDPGDEVIVFEPFYENYGPDTILADARPVYVPLEPGQPLDLDRLAAAFTARTRAIVVNTPSNPAGRVLTRPELDAIARLCREHDVLAVTDEIYEHIRYHGEHVPIATLPGMRERTVTISSAGKTFSMTGWKTGWACAPAPLVEAVRTVKQFVTYVHGAPSQHAAAAGLRLPDEYFTALAGELAAKRDLLASGLADAGFTVYPPSGTYFVTADIRPFGKTDGMAFCRSLPERCGVVAVPTVVFYDDVEAGSPLVRFTFCKRREVLEDAVVRLKSLEK